MLLLYFFCQTCVFFFQILPVFLRLVLNLPVFLCLVLNSSRPVFHFLIGFRSNQKSRFRSNFLSTVVASVLVLKDCSSIFPPHLYFFPFLKSLFLKSPFLESSLALQCRQVLMQTSFLFPSSLLTLTLTSTLFYYKESRSSFFFPIFILLSYFL